MHGERPNSQHTYPRAVALTTRSIDVFFRQQKPRLSVLSMIKRTEWRVSQGSSLKSRTVCGDCIHNHTSFANLFHPSLGWRCFSLEPNLRPTALGPKPLMVLTQRGASDNTSVQAIRSARTCFSPQPTNLNPKNLLAKPTIRSPKLTILSPGP